MGRYNRECGTLLGGLQDDEAPLLDCGLSISAEIWAAGLSRRVRRILFRHILHSAVRVLRCAVECAGVSAKRRSEVVITVAE